MTPDWLRAIQANPDLLDNFLAYLADEGVRVAHEVIASGTTAEDLAEARGRKKMLEYLRQLATLEATEASALMDFRQRSRGR